MTDEMLDRLERLLREATPGPWEALESEHSPGWALIQVEGKEWEIVTAGANFAEEHDLTLDDAALIVAAVNALPELLAAARERDVLAGRVEAVRALVLDDTDGPEWVRRAGGRYMFTGASILDALDADGGAE